MLSQLGNSSSQFVYSIFISGVSEEFITKLIQGPNITNNNKEGLIYPEILFRYPQNDSGITPSVLEYIFAEGVSIEFNLQPPKFIPVVLTNEKGGRTYVYSIRLFDKIEINHKNYYLPYILSIWSPINNCEGFKNILTEFYRIMKISGDNINETSIINYHNLEIIHMIIFLTDIIIPPNNSKIILNFHFSSVEFNFPSLSEIPNNEEYIQLLFDCLEISTIIKLWCSLLSEKHIIFLANQGYLLFAITQGLLSLMFPFSWLHTYIPVLPLNQIDYLDSPTPYVIGVISNKIDYMTLNEKYPGHVICDLNSSTINKNGVSFLSNIEEDKIKKKIRYLYNPKMFEAEDIYLDENDKKKYNNKNFELEDIDMNKSFGENIHYIFFRIFRYQLSVIQSNFVKNKVFDIQIFLEDFCQDEMRDFWDKLASTVAFDNFLMSLNNIDNDPFSKICLNILSSEKDDNENDDNNIKNNITNTKNKLKKNSSDLDNSKTKKDILIIKYNLPSNINYILNQFMEIENKNDDDGKALENLKNDYNLSLNQINNNNQSLNDYFSKNKARKRTSLNEEYLSKFIVRNNSLFCPHKNKNNIILETNKINRVPSPPTLNLSNDTDKENSLLTSPKLEGMRKSSCKNNDNFERKEGRRPSLILMLHKTNKNLFYLYGLDTIKSIEQKMIKNHIRKLSGTPKARNESIMSFEEDDNGLFHQDFLSFSNFFFVTLTLKNHITLGYKSIFIKKIKILLTKNNENIENDKSENNSSIEVESESPKSKKQLPFILSEQKDSIKTSNDSSDFELNNESSSNLSGKKNSPKKNINFKDDTDAKNHNNLLLRQSIFKPEYLEYLDLIEISSNELSQFFLFSAFILELDNIDGFNKHIFTILKLYEKSFLENNKEFSYKNFYRFLKKIDYIMLHSYYMRINDSKEYDDKIKTYLNIIELRLKQIESKEKLTTRKIRTFKSMKIVTLPESFKDSLKHHKGDINSNSNKSIFQFQNLLKNDKNFLNNSVLNYFNTRRNSEHQEGNNQLKINILNLYKKYKKTTKDPLQIIEEIAVHIYLFILKKSLHKIQPEIITSKLLQSLQNSAEFQPIKELVAELQVIDLKYLLKISDEHKTTFWLNIFNFLMIFAVIYRKENLLTYYEWHKLKKNSYFNIGGINFSLYEIENVILRNNYMSKKLFSEIIDFPKGDSRNKFKLDNVIKYMNFAISEPMTSSFKLQIYFPQTIEKQILKNAIDYFNSRIIVDGKNILVKIPEYLSWVDDNFLGNLNYYKDIMNNDVYDFINKNQDKVKFIKHDWSLNFSDSIV